MVSSEQEVGLGDLQRCLPSSAAGILHWWVAVESLQMAEASCVENTQSVSSVCFQMLVLLAYIQALIFPVDLHLFYHLYDLQVFFTARKAHASEIVGQSLE